ncbi:hypothetical protein EON80_23635 [bacterium]|nr:MAG: hypothetical protein EON80_23635 [bacterium]
MIVEDPEPGQDAITEKRDWTASERQNCARHNRFAKSAFAATSLVRVRLGALVLGGDLGTDAGIS